MSKRDARRARNQRTARTTVVVRTPWIRPPEMRKARIIARGTVRWSNSAYECLRTLLRRCLRACRLGARTPSSLKAAIIEII